jgi:hypothetical protein
LIVPLRPVTFELEDGTDWQAAANQCHQNATDLAEVYPDKLEVVRGWLVFDYRPYLPTVEFMHHSVVRARDNGDMFDPTPQQRLNPDYPFLVALAEDGDFEQFVLSLAPGERLVYPFGMPD